MEDIDNLIVALIQIGQNEIEDPDVLGNLKSFMKRRSNLLNMYSTEIETFRYIYATYMINRSEKEYKQFTNIAFSSLDNKQLVYLYIGYITMYAADAFRNDYYSDLTVDNDIDNHMKNTILDELLISYDIDNIILFMDYLNKEDIKQILLFFTDIISDKMKVNLNIDSEVYIVKSILEYKPSFGDININIPQLFKELSTDKDLSNDLRNVIFVLFDAYIKSIFNTNKDDNYDDIDEDE